MIDKKREAGDKTKGFTLQKQRAIILFFDVLKSNPNAHVNVAIEYEGDVYLQNDEIGYVEEQKNYDKESSFSFNSHQILNTLAYFLEIWFRNEKSENLIFGFYSTNKIAKEKKTDTTEELNISLPKESILKLLITNNYEKENLLDSVKKYLISEYENQYGKDISTELDDDALISFLDKVNWRFEQENDKELKGSVIKALTESEMGKGLKGNQTDFIYASIMCALEEKQDEKDPFIKFLNKESVENLCLKIRDIDDLPNRAFKYVDFDYSELLKKTANWLNVFLNSKYSANVINKKLPDLIARKVARHNDEIKIYAQNLKRSDPKEAAQLEAIVGELHQLIHDPKPTFLFGEMGSGKSTMLARFFLEEIKKDNLLIFIPSNFIKGRIDSELRNLKEKINEFVNEEIDLENKSFNLSESLRLGKEITLAFDGLDELDKSEIIQLIKHIGTLHSESNRLRIIATGRPIELKGFVNFNSWNCLTTLDLSTEEIKRILKNEARAEGLNEQLALADAKNRFEHLNRKGELLSIATTPLIICLIRDYLTSEFESKTTAEILYEVIKKKLTWHTVDQKESLKDFIDAYPNSYQREHYLGEIAYRIYRSESGKLNNNELFECINDLTPEGEKKNKIVDQVITFFKSIFLQEDRGGYSFQSHQLWQFVLGMSLLEKLSSGFEFHFKDSSRIEFWREISFAAGLARLKGKTNKIKDFLSSILDELMFSIDNTAAASILLAEAQVGTLNIQFLSRVQNLEFRPLRFWGRSDFIVPYAYAYIFKNLGDDGFNWFFESYINPDHPSHHGHNEGAVKILSHYLVISNYQLNVNEKKKLISAKNPHIAAKTFSCHDLVPTIATVIPEEFKLDECCILLADALSNPVVHEKSKSILTNYYNEGSEAEVLNALEIVCRNKNYSFKEALKLWLSLCKENLPNTLLNRSIDLIAKGDFEMVEIIRQRISWDNLISYLRFCCLYRNEICVSAAIILFEFEKERDVNLVGWPLLYQSSRLDDNYVKVESILNELITNTPRSKELVLSNIREPKNDSLGIEEIYLEHFLETLIQEKEIYESQFLHVVRHLGKFTLDRYPSIRDKFKKVLSNEHYYKTIKSSLTHLDSHLRYNSACILLTSFPRQEKESLEIIIRSSFPWHSEHHEWLRFCLKLDYSNDMLDLIIELLDDLSGIPKIYAIKILYHNNEYKLQDSHLDILIDGIFGEAYFLDWSRTLIGDDIQKISEEKRFFDRVKSQLSSDNISYRERAANYLIRYESELCLKERAQCYVLNVRYSELNFPLFHQKCMDLFDMSEFTDELIRYEGELISKFNIKHLLLPQFYKCIKLNGDWKEFFVCLLNHRNHVDHHRLETVYPLLINYSKTEEHSKKIGKSLVELMSLPAYSQDVQYNFILPYFAILADQFNCLKRQELLDVLAKYRINHDELLCAILSRIGSIPETFVSPRGHIEHISLFSTNPIKEAKAYTTDEIDKLLYDGEDIAVDLTNGITWVLLNGIYSEEELQQLKKKGNLATYFGVIVAFSRNQRLSLESFLDGDEIGSYKHFAKGATRHHKSILHAIKAIVLDDGTYRSEYIEIINNSIGKGGKREDIDLIEELIDLSTAFSPELVVKYFESLLDVPYRLKLYHLYHINQHILGFEERDRLELIKPIRIILNSVTSIGFERNESELELLAWELSLIALFIENKSDDLTERGFLIGLRNAFIQNSGREYQSGNNKISFKGRDMFVHCSEILNEIDSHVIATIIKRGANSDVPEIRAVCKLIRSLSVIAN